MFLPWGRCRGRHSIRGAKVTTLSEGSPHFCLDRLVSAIHPSWLGILSDPVRLAVVAALCGVREANVTQISGDTHVSERTVRRHLNALIELGLAYEQQGRNDDLLSGRPATRFALDGSARARVIPLFDLLSEPLVPPP